MAKASSRGALPGTVLRWATFGLADDVAPLLAAWIKGGLIGLGLSVAAATLSQPINRELRFVALLLEKTFEFYPVAAAGILIGGALGLLRSQMKKHG